MAHRDTQIAFTDRERDLLEQVARERGVEVDEVIEQLAREALESRYRSRIGKRPAPVVRLTRAQ
jgi:hypothetical protein